MLAARPAPTPDVLVGVLTEMNTMSACSSTQQQASTLMRSAIFAKSTLLQSTLATDQQLHAA
jgi:hypothetical protein